MAAGQRGKVSDRAPQRVVWFAGQGAAAPPAAGTPAVRFGLCTNATSTKSDVRMVPNRSLLHCEIGGDKAKVQFPEFGMFTGFDNIKNIGESLSNKGIWTLA